MNHNKITTKEIAKIAILGALAFVLMLIEFPLPFAPAFYKLDFSETAVLMGGFALGPLAAVVIEALKIVLKLLFKGTSTVFVGEFANFAVGCALTVPAAILYKKHKTKRGALMGMVLGTLCMTIAGGLVNYFVMLPMYSSLYNMPMDVIIGMGTAIIPAVKDMFTFVLLCTVPFNLVKGVLVSLVTFLLYKHVSPILHK